MHGGARVGRSYLEGRRRGRARGNRGELGRDGAASPAHRLGAHRAPGIVMCSGVAVLNMTPETKDEPGTHNDAAKEEEHSKERPKNQPQGDRR